MNLSQMISKFGGKGGKDVSVGLDIGTYSVKVVAIEKEAEENTLTAYNVKRAPFDKKDVAVEQLIEEALDEVDLRPDAVNLAVSGPDVIVRFVNLPQMNKEQLGNALAFEAEKYIPFNIDEVFLDSLILGDAPESGQMRVLLAAAKRSPVESVIKKIEKLGMMVSIVDTDPFAMFNAFTWSNPELEDKGKVFLDLGHSRTEVLISIGSDPHFMRQIQIGGKNITDAICQDMSVSPEKAEEYKLGIGVEDKETVMKATTSVLDDLIKEMRLSFGYFENRCDASVTDIYCSGGLIYQAGVAEYLSEKLGNEVKRWNPAEKIKISENISRQDIDSVASQLAVSIGLALRD